MLQITLERPGNFTAADVPEPNDPPTPPSGDLAERVAALERKFAALKAAL